MKSRFPYSLYSSFILLLFFVVRLGGPAHGSDLAANDILERVRATFSEIRDYAVNIHAEIDMENVRVPPMNVEIFFKQPDKIRMKSKGFAMLPKEVVFLNLNRFSGENFYMSLLGRETLGQTEAYVLELVPRKEEIKVRKLTLWVDSERWIPLRVYTISLRGPTVNVDFEYDLFHEKYWLPVRINAKIDMADFKGFTTHHRFPNDEEDDMEKSQAKEGKMTIEFSDYRINKGLADSMFEKEIKHNVR